MTSFIHLVSQNKSGAASRRGLEPRFSWLLHEPPPEVHCSHLAIPLDEVLFSTVFHNEDAQGVELVDIYFLILAAGGLVTTRALLCGLLFFYPSNTNLKYLPSFFHALLSSAS